MFPEASFARRCGTLNVEVSEFLAVRGVAASPSAGSETQVRKPAGLPALKLVVSAVDHHGTGAAVRRCLAATARSPRPKLRPQMKSQPAPQPAHWNCPPPLPFHKPTVDTCVCLQSPPPRNMLAGLPVFHRLLLFESQLHQCHDTRDKQFRPAKQRFAEDGRSRGRPAAA